MPVAGRFNPRWVSKHRSGGQPILGEEKVLAGELDIGWIATARGRDGMDAAAGRAFADKGRQDERAAAALASRLQPAARDGPLPERPAVGLIDEFDKLASLGKGSGSASVV